MYNAVSFPNPLSANIYRTVQEARKLAVIKTKEYHEKNKIHYDSKFVDINFNPKDLVIYEGSDSRIL